MRVRHGISRRVSGRALCQWEECEWEESVSGRAVCQWEGTVSVGGV